MLVNEIHKRVLDVNIDNYINTIKARPLREEILNNIFEDILNNELIEFNLNGQTDTNCKLHNSYLKLFKCIDTILYKSIARTGSPDYIKLAVDYYVTRVMNIGTRGTEQTHTSINVDCHNDTDIDNNLNYCILRLNKDSALCRYLDNKKRRMFATNTKVNKVTAQINIVQPELRNQLTKLTALSEIIYDSFDLLRKMPGYLKDTLDVMEHNIVKHALSCTTQHMFDKVSEFSRCNFPIDSTTINLLDVSKLMSAINRSKNNKNYWVVHKLGIEFDEVNFSRWNLQVKKDASANDNKDIIPEYICSFDLMDITEYQSSDDIMVDLILQILLPACNNIKFNEVIDERKSEVVLSLEMDFDSSILKDIVDIIYDYAINLSNYANVLNSIGTRQGLFYEIVNFGSKYSPQKIIDSALGVLVEDKYSNHPYNQDIVLTDNDRRKILMCNNKEIFYNESARIFSTITDILTNNSATDKNLQKYQLFLDTMDYIIVTELVSELAYIVKLYTIEINSDISESCDKTLAAMKIQGVMDRLGYNKYRGVGLIVSKITEYYSACNNFSTMGMIHESCIKDKYYYKSIFEYFDDTVFNVLNNSNLQINVDKGSTPKAVSYFLKCIKRQTHIY